MEVLFIVSSLLCTLVIVHQIALYGLFEIGIMRPMNIRAYGAAFVGVGINYLFGYLHKYHIINVPIFDKPNYPLVAGLFLVLPLIYFYFVRRVLLPAGLSDFNRAKIRTNHWALGTYEPGVRHDDKAESLRSFSKAIEAEECFKMAIKAQEKGTPTYILEREIDIDIENADFYDKFIVNCPACGVQISFPRNISSGVTSRCGICGAFVGARQLGTKLYVTTHLSKKIYIVKDSNRFKVAIIYCELAYLYRVEHRFDDARDALMASMTIATSLLDKIPNDRDILSLTSMIEFRLGELEHALGNRALALAHYRRSEQIDQGLGHFRDVEIVNELVDKLG